MTTIVNYGAGNIRSVENTLAELGAQYEVTNDPAVVLRASKIILPGVGHFGQMMQAIDNLGLRAPLKEKIASGLPFLGICVGLQCLFEKSEEAPEAAGLAVLPGEVKRFVGDARIPHMGWNSLEQLRPTRLLQGIDPRRLHILRPQLLRSGHTRYRRELYLFAPIFGNSRTSESTRRSVSP